MAVFLAVVDLIKGVAWPTVLLLLVIFYRTELVKVLPRLREAGPTGIKLDSAEQQQIGATPSLGNSTDALGTVSLGPARAAVKFVESRYRSELSSVPEDRRVEVLLRQLALARLTAHFEATYRLIFGTQINALRQLNSVFGMSLDDLRIIYDGAADQRPGNLPFNFESWVSFLVGQELVTQVGTRVSLTDVGRDFLLYITDHKMPEPKPF